MQFSVPASSSYAAVAAEAWADNVNAEDGLPIAALAASNRRAVSEGPPLPYNYQQQQQQKQQEGYHHNPPQPNAFDGKFPRASSVPLVTTVHAGFALPTDARHLEGDGWRPPAVSSFRSSAIGTAAATSVPPLPSALPASRLRTVSPQREAANTNDGNKRGSHSPSPPAGRGGASLLSSRANNKENAGNGNGGTEEDEDSGHVRILVRVRPFSSQELSAEQQQQRRHPYDNNSKNTLILPSASSSPQPSAAAPSHLLKGSSAAASNHLLSVGSGGSSGQSFPITPATEFAIPLPSGAGAASSISTSPSPSPPRDDDIDAAGAEASARQQLHHPSTQQQKHRQYNASITAGGKHFSFDSVFTAADDTSTLYNASPLRRMVLNDFRARRLNCSVLAYGQTGTGKTHTVEGLLPLILADMFGAPPYPSEEDGSTAPTTTTTAPTPPTIRRLYVSYVEVYGDTVYDLLSTAASSGPSSSPSPGASAATPSPKPAINVFEAADGTITVPSTRVLCSSASDVLAVVAEGAAARTVAATAMNATSSRSHAVLTMEFAPPLPQTSSASPTSAAHQPYHHPAAQLHPPAPHRHHRFTVVDLAGSERNKKTNNAGDRFKESVAINQGLLALGNVIRALAAQSTAAAATGGSQQQQQQRRATSSPATSRHRSPSNVNTNAAATTTTQQHFHIPYRSSKLTRMLQDCLCANAKTFFIACVGPSSANADETLRTLQYCAKATRIAQAPRPSLYQAPEAAGQLAAAGRTGLKAGAGAQRRAASAQLAREAVLLAQQQQKEQKERLLLQQQAALATGGAAAVTRRGHSARPSAATNPFASDHVGTAHHRSNANVADLSTTANADASEEHSTAVDGEGSSTCTFSVHYNGDGDHHSYGNGAVDASALTVASSSAAFIAAAALRPSPSALAAEALLRAHQRFRRQQQQGHYPQHASFLVGGGGGMGLMGAGNGLSETGNVGNLSSTHSDPLHSHSHDASAAAADEQPNSPLRYLTSEELARRVRAERDRIDREVRRRRAEGRTLAMDASVLTNYSAVNASAYARGARRAREALLLRRAASNIAATAAAVPTPSPISEESPHSPPSMLRTQPLAANTNGGDGAEEGEADSAADTTTSFAVVEANAYVAGADKTINMSPTCLLASHDTYAPPPPLPPAPSSPKSRQEEGRRQRTAAEVEALRPPTTLLSSGSRSQRVDGNNNSSVEKKANSPPAHHSASGSPNSLASHSASPSPRPYSSLLPSSPSVVAAGPVVAHSSNVHTASPSPSPSPPLDIASPSVVEALQRALAEERVKAQQAAEALAKAKEELREDESVFATMLEDLRTARREKRLLEERLAYSEGRQQQQIRPTEGADNDRGSHRPHSSASSASPNGHPPLNNSPRPLTCTIATSTTELTTHSLFGTRLGGVEKEAAAPAATHSPSQRRRRPQERHNHQQHHRSKEQRSDSRNSRTPSASMSPSSARTANDTSIGAISNTSHGGGGGGRQRHSIEDLQPSGQRRMPQSTTRRQSSSQQQQQQQPPQLPITTTAAAAIPMPSPLPSHHFSRLPIVPSPRAIVAVAASPTTDGLGLSAALLRQKTAGAASGGGMAVVSGADGSPHQHQNHGARSGAPSADGRSFANVSPISDAEAMFGASATAFSSHHHRSSAPSNPLGLGGGGGGGGAAAIAGGRRRSSVVNGTIVRGGHSPSSIGGVSPLSATMPSPSRRDGDDDGAGAYMYSGGGVSTATATDGEEGGLQQHQQQQLRPLPQSHSSGAASSHRYGGAEEAGGTAHADEEEGEEEEEGADAAPILLSELLSDESYHVQQPPAADDSALPSAGAKEKAKEPEERAGHAPLPSTTTARAPSLVVPTTTTAPGAEVKAVPVVDFTRIRTAEARRRGGGGHHRRGGGHHHHMGGTAMYDDDEEAADGVRIGDADDSRSSEGGSAKSKRDRRPLPQILVYGAPVAGAPATEAQQHLPNNGPHGHHTYDNSINNNTNNGHHGQQYAHHADPSVSGDASSVGSAPPSNTIRILAAEFESEERRATARALFQSSEGLSPPQRQQPAPAKDGTHSRQPQHHQRAGGNGSASVAVAGGPHSQPQRGISVLPNTANTNNGGLRASVPQLASSFASLRPLTAASARGGGGVGGQQGLVGYGGPLASNGQFALNDPYAQQQRLEAMRLAASSAAAGSRSLRSNFGGLGGGGGGAASALSLHYGRAEGQQQQQRHSSHQQQREQRGSAPKGATITVVRPDGTAYTYAPSEAEADEREEREEEGYGMGGTTNDEAYTDNDRFGGPNDVTAAGVGAASASSVPPSSFATTAGAEVAFPSASSHAGSALGYPSHVAGGRGAVTSVRLFASEDSSVAAAAEMPAMPVVMHAAFGQVQSAAIALRSDVATTDHMRLKLLRPEHRRQ